MPMAADSSPSNQNDSPRVGGGADGGSSSPVSRRGSLPSAWAQVVRGEPESPSPSSSSITSSGVVASVGAAPRSSSSSPPIAAASASAVAQEQTAGSSSSASSTDCSASTAPMPAGGSGGSSNVHAESSVESNGNVATSRRPAWNRPVNGVVEPVTVMGDTVSWPALSESTRPSPRSNTESPRPTSDGSTSAPQGSIVNQSPQRQVNANANANANANTTHANHANHATPGRQRSTRHRGGNNNSNAAGGSGQGGFTRPVPPPPPMPPPFPVFEMAYGNVLPPPLVMDPSVRAPRSMGGVGPQPHAANDHSSQRSSSRRGNFGGRPRGDGSYHNNHGGRREQDRRDVHVPQFVPPPPAFIPPPPPGTPPYGPVPMRPFHGPMGFDMAASPFIYVPTLPPDSFRGMPLVPQGPPSPMFYPIMEPNLPATIVSQIEYYFSDDNLVKDNFLRSNMDEEGWVPISLIAKFPRVAQLTPSTQFILESLRASSVVEVQVDKVRRRDGWAKWIQTSARSTSDSALDTTGTSVDNVLATSMQAVTLDEATSSRSSTTDAGNAQTDADHNELSSGELTSQSTPANSDSKAAGESSSQS